MLKVEKEIIPMSTREIKLESYVISYKEEGESIVVFLKADNNIFYSIVIDSYETTANRTIEILDQNNIKSIDLFCWTHPHKDHSLGINKILKKYCCSNTKVIIPNIDKSLKKSIPLVCRNTYFKVCGLNRFGRKSNGQLVFGMLDLSIKSSSISWGIYNMPFNIYCLAPSSSCLGNNKFNARININDFSLALAIQMNDVWFVFGGDVENKMYNFLKLNNYALDNVAFLKVPHHGSSSADSIFDVVHLNENSVCAITNYNNGDICLPEADIVTEYNKHSNEIYLFNDKDDSVDYGILRSEFIFYNINNVVFKNWCMGKSYHLNC